MFRIISAAIGFEKEDSFAGNHAAFMGGISDDCFSYLIEERLGPLFLWATEKHIADIELSKIQRDVIKLEYSRSIARQIIHQKIFIEITGILNSNGIKSFPLKGIHLCETAYPAPGLRPMDDIDILVSKENYRAAIDVLTSHGYSLEPEFYKESAGELPDSLSLRHQGRADGIHIDIHRSLLNESGIRSLLIKKNLLDSLNNMAFDLNEETVYLDGAINILSKPFHLLYCMLHHYTHNFTGALWFFDIALISKGMNDEEWTVFEKLVSKAGLKKLTAAYFELLGKIICVRKEFLMPERLIYTLNDVIKKESIVCKIVEKGRLTPFLSLAIMPGFAAKFKAVLCLVFPEKTYLELSSRRKLNFFGYWVELVKFQKRVFTR